MTDSLTAEESEAVLIALTNRVSANLPLHTALTALAEESSSPQAKRVLREMDRRLQAGEPADAVICSLHERLPATVGRLLQGGLEIGRLDLVMQFLVSQRQWDRDFRHRLTTGFAYPTVVLFFFTGWVLFVLLGIVPQMKRLYEGFGVEFGVELPGATMLLLGTSDILVNGGVWLIPVLPAVMIGGWWWLCFGNIARFFSRSGRRIPIIGPIVNLRQFSEFCDVLAILLEGRLELPKALRMSSAGISNPVLRSTCLNLAERIEYGEPISSAASTLELPHAFSLVLRQDPCDGVRELRALANVYNTKGDSTVQALMTGVDITVMMGVSIMIVLILAGLLMPLIKLLNDLS